MKDLPDIAAKLYTNEYRAVKLKGKKARKNAAGTGSVSSHHTAFFQLASLQSSKKNKQLTVRLPIYYIGSL